LSALRTGRCNPRMFTGGWAGKITEIKIPHVSTCNKTCHLPTNFFKTCKLQKHLSDNTNNRQWDTKRLRKYRLWFLYEMHFLPQATVGLSKQYQPVQWRLLCSIPGVQWRLLCSIPGVQWRLLCSIPGSAVNCTQTNATGNVSSYLLKPVTTFQLLTKITVQNHSSYFLQSIWQIRQ